MSENRAYPNKDIERSAAAKPAKVGAPIAHVEAGSPAYDAGFEPGCFITTVDGRPVRDLIDWRWLSAGDEISLGYVDLDGDSGTVEIWREAGEDWGFEFDGLVFDGVKQCRNACTFCFMHQLPRGMRRSLYLRDDDFRLSFLLGTFVTLTNVSAADEQRIIEQRISPLRVSLQAAAPKARERLIGKFAQHGIDVLERLLAAGIEFHAQIVLVPGGNDGDVLADTLKWAYARPGILGIGVVPLGYTKHQQRFTRSFNEPEQAREVLQLLEPFQQRALSQRGHVWVHAADEFYCNAYGEEVASRIPPTSHYGDFAMFEDGIGIIRSTLNDWEAACTRGDVDSCATALKGANVRAVLVVGCAQREFLSGLIGGSPLEGFVSPLYVDNGFFGGNVDVTGLLCGCDIVRAVRDACCAKDGERPDETLFCIPRVILNDDGLTLDGMTVSQMEQQAGTALHVVSCSPADYLPEIRELSLTIAGGC